MPGRRALAYLVGSVAVLDLAAVSGLLPLAIARDISSTDTMLSVFFMVSNFLPVKASHSSLLIEPSWSVSMARAWKLTPPVAKLLVAAAMGIVSLPLDIMAHIFSA